MNRIDFFGGEPVEGYLISNAVGLRGGNWFSDLTCCDGPNGNNLAIKRERYLDMTGEKMTGSVQKGDVSVVGKQSAVAKYGIGTNVSLGDVSVVQLNVRPGGWSADGKPIFSGKADPSNALLVQIYDYGKVIGNAVVHADGTWSFEPRLPLASGPHRFQAEPIDATGHVGEQTDALSFDLDGPAPAVPVITGVYDDAGTITGNIQKGYPTDDTKPTLEGTAGPGTLVQVWDGDVLVGSAEVDVSGDWVIVTKALGDGEHRLAATATDGAGQVSPPTDEYLVLVDTTPPATPDMPSAYDDGKVVAGPGVEDVTLTTGHPVLSGVGEFGEKVSIRDKGVLIGTATVGSDGGWSFVPAKGLNQGAHEITVTLRDRAGNVSAPSDGLRLMVDTSREPLHTRSEDSTEGRSGNAGGMFPSGNFLGL
ncbi:Ig-like domain-containing protein [Diaphorobacter caeni]|uniref:Ig-like domain-containing protein n=1 Tax=Diaphorobacter caeni TaxID=2784387 RepID=UPI00189020C5|nr:Ig-like domain-containing protein [Diaphorobacter caeni]MBF5004745.1 hypothetical protein [Diaphorobacter caeni]